MQGCCLKKELNRISWQAQGTGYLSQPSPPIKPPTPLELGCEKSDRVQSKINAIILGVAHDLISQKPSTCPAIFQQSTFPCNVYFFYKLDTLEYDNKDTVHQSSHTTSKHSRTQYTSRRRNFQPPNIGNTLWVSYRMLFSLNSVKGKADLHLWSITGFTGNDTETNHVSSASQLWWRCGTARSVMRSQVKDVYKSKNQAVRNVERHSTTDNDAFTKTTCELSARHEQNHKKQRQ